MRTKLAMVACKEAAKGPWIRSRGDETGVRVSGLGVGELIEMVVEVGKDQKSFCFDTNGEYPLPEAWTRLRMEKHITDAKTCSATFVDLLVA